MKRCDTCEHYDNNKCKLDPPTPIMDSQDNLKTVWPKVYPDSWCGQWELASVDAPILAETDAIDLWEG